jgi:hypothetical protein
MAYTETTCLIARSQTEEACAMWMESWCLAEQTLGALALESATQTVRFIGSPISPLLFHGKT